jgi:hypothetical protein
MDSSPCEFCGNDVPLSWERCPHCARPGLFPNVRAAQVPSEREALESRYQEALQQAEGRGAGEAVRTLERAAQETKAVMARSFRELDRLASSDRELFSTYYKLLDAEVRLPHGEDWDERRETADSRLFSSRNKEQIRFALLSLDGTGLPHYGECSFVFRESMIAHRASVYEENSTVFLEKHAYRPPPGYRAPWEERAKLSVAKLAGEIPTATTAEQCRGLFVVPGASPEEDRFIEVHIWGPLSIRTVERVVTTSLERRWRSLRMALHEHASAVGMSLEEL